MELDKTPVKINFQFRVRAEHNLPPETNPRGSIHTLTMMTLMDRATALTYQKGDSVDIRHGPGLFEEGRITRVLKTHILKLNPLSSAPLGFEFNQSNPTVIPLGTHFALELDVSEYSIY